MGFERRTSGRWHEEVPGSRWFRADLHVHTLDDLPGGGVSVPASVHGGASDPEVLRRYARVFLQAAVRTGVEVLGLTPHAVRAGDAPDSSAIWHIIRVWNEEADDDGIPFQNKIYAVFPGFEPNVNDGRSGIHLLFLFDPEIGRDRFLALFEAVMDSRAPWDGKHLRMTERDAKAICGTIDARREESRGSGRPWDYLILAPHFQNHHGLLQEAQKQVLETFPCERLAGYELGDEKLPDVFDESRNPGRFLLPFMREHRQAFFHASDAYHLPEEGAIPGPGQLGHRVTWVKLASPRIEALRQAFIASESRLRIAYERGEDDSLRSIEHPPVILDGTRPWLRRVKVSGEAAFFGGPGREGPRTTTVDFSPDLTCIIGGSMTGKSALLDGLRVHVGAELPAAGSRPREDVEARGKGRFLAGHPEVIMETPGRPEGPLLDRWPAIFFTQNELQRLAQDPGKVEDILARLVPTEREAILERDGRLQDLDASLRSQARVIGELLDQRVEAEQKLAAAKDAASQLEAFKEAGLANLRASEKLQGEIVGVAERATVAEEQLGSIEDLLDIAGVEIETEDQIRETLRRLDLPLSEESLKALHEGAVEATTLARAAVSRWSNEVRTVLDLIERAVVSDRQTVERRLAEQGYQAEKLAEFQALSRRAGFISSYQAAFGEVDAKLVGAQERFEQTRSKRQELVNEQRRSFDRVRDVVENQFEGRIRVRRIDYGIWVDLEEFLLGFRQKGISQWWNGLDPRSRPAPETMYQKIESGGLTDLGASPTVAARFREVFTEAKRNELRALRSPDRYLLEHRVGDGKYREAGELSGGKRVSLLLSLLLEAHDPRPLVIDQPEDELDHRFLWESVLPALRRLKGRRQVIVATHDANIVVNGDADLVVQLEADADHGRVAVSGAIEDPEVRTAIIETVDGGEKAFELRKAKYGF